MASSTVGANLPAPSASGSKKPSRLATASPSRFAAGDACVDVSARAVSVSAAPRSFFAFTIFLRQRIARILRPRQPHVVDGHLAELVAERPESGHVIEVLVRGDEHVQMIAGDRRECPLSPPPA